MMVEVKNLNGTSKERYSKPKGYSSWLKYWEAESIFSIPNKCACDGCSNEVNVGAHVKKTTNDNKWYVVHYVINVIRNQNHLKSMEIFW